ncbi:MAG: AAA family ATPase [Candidatus Omnitrophica bacterium]|nr:AAA family ATPase [Candidatus Omnitrophota bacterium]
MAEPRDPNQAQRDMMENMRRMMSQFGTRPDPQAERVREQEEEKQRQKRKEVLSFDLKPKDVKKYLDRYVIKQEDAKRVLATAVCDHYNHVKRQREKGKSRHYVKQNVLMLGKTGVGKTFLIRSLSELIGVPFIKADATKFSETGYVGGDVDDLVRDLVHKADGDMELAECGMIYIDEIDKIAAPSNVQGRDVSGSGVQRGLLKIMEETEVPLRNPQDIQSQIQSLVEFQQKGKTTRPMINTRNILFIVSGAFEGLAAITEKRVKSLEIGFSSSAPKHIPKEDLFRASKTEDFIQFGFEPEFIGRLPVRVICDPLSAQDLYTILTVSEGSILRQYEESFRAYGIEIQFNDDALWEIAKRASNEGTGARGLVTICEKIFRDLKYELPSSRLKSFRLTREMVASPKKGMEELLQEEREEKIREIELEITEFEKIFSDKNGIAIEFDPKGRRAIQEHVLEESVQVKPFLENLLSNYPHGLELIRKKEPRHKYVLNQDVVKDPNHFLEEWIKNTYETGPIKQR